MSAHRFINPIRLFQTILIVVLCGIITLSVSADNGDKRASNKRPENSQTARRGSDSNDKKSSNSNSSDKNARSQENKPKDSSNNRDSARQESNANNNKNSRQENRNQDQSKYQSSKRSEQKPADNRKDNDTGKQKEYNRPNTPIKRNIPTVQYNTGDKRNGSGRQASWAVNDKRDNNNIKRPDEYNIPNSQQIKPGPQHNNSWDKRADDYRKPESPSNDKRSKEYNNNTAKRSFRPPVFKNGFYHYSERPQYKPSRYGYWVFNYDDSYYCRRSAYYYYGYFPYLQITRIITAPYSRVNYYNGFAIGDYYLSNNRYYEVDDALRDVREAWISRRPDLIENHININRNIAVLLDGEYDYSINSTDYAEMTADAIDEIRTINFTWQGLRQRADGCFTAFGVHQYYDYYGTPKTVYVSYTFERIRGYCYIVEVGSSVNSLF